LLPAADAHASGEINKEQNRKFIFVLDFKHNIKNQNIHKKLFAATASYEETKGLRIKQQPDTQQQEISYHEH